MKKRKEINWRVPVVDQGKAAKSALRRRGLNNFHSMKKWGWSGMWGKVFKSQARVWEMECLNIPCGGSSLPSSGVSRSAAQGLLTMVASPKLLDRNIKIYIVHVGVTAEHNNPRREARLLQKVKWTKSGGWALWLQPHHDRIGEGQKITVILDPELTSLAEMAQEQFGYHVGRHSFG